MSENETHTITSKPPLRIGVILTTYSVVLAVLPILIVVGIALNLFRQHTQDQIVNQMTALAEAKTQDIRRWLETSQTLIDLMLTNPEQYRRMQDILVARGPTGPRGIVVTKFLIQQRELQNTFEELYLYNREGEIRISTDNSRVEQNIRAQPYFEPGLQAEAVFVQPPYFDTERGNLTSVVLKPIYHQSGNVIGVLVGRLNLNTLSSIMTSRVGLGNTGETYLVSREQRTFVTLGRFESDTPPQNPTSYGIETVLAGTDGTALYTNYRGQEVIGVHRWIAELQSGMLAEIETAEAFAALNNIQLVSLAIAGTVACIALAIGLGINRWITAPIQRLTRVAMAMMQGDYGQRARIQSRNEIGRLSLAFDAMATKMENLIEGLEQKVAERTHQLEIQAEELRTAKEAAEVARRRAEEANSLKTNFIANMSHELRTPLNSIINFTRILSSGTRGPINPDQADYLNRVFISGEHLLGLINDILDFAKIEAGRMELFKEEVNLGDLVQSTISTAIGLTKDKPITLHHKIEPDLPLIEIDRTRIRQVLLNLLSNAAKFTNEGSITVQVWKQQYQIIISVTDTGIGIPADKFETIFEEFRQADEGSHRSYQGTGLGLHICKRLLEMHGGSIWVESTLGAGSTFFFSLPIQSSTKVGQPDPGTENGWVILTINDDEDALETARKYLVEDGYTVYGLTNSQQVLEEVRRLRPAAILLDILMSFKDGWDVLKELKDDSEFCHIPVILYSMAEEQKLGLHLGASAYLVKPIQESQLRNVIRQLVPYDSTILVIDDNPNVLEMISYYLERAGGYHVVTSNNGQEGLFQALALLPDLIVLDLMMHELDGFAVLDELERDPRTRTIPVVILTAKDLTREERRYLNGRVHGLQQKAATSPDDLVRWIDALVHRESTTADGETQAQQPKV